MEDFKITDALLGKTPPKKIDPMEEYKKGLWCGLELEAEYKKRIEAKNTQTNSGPMAPYEADALRLKQKPSGLEYAVNTLNDRAKMKQDDKKREEREALKQPRVSHGIIKLMRDWQESYHRY